MNELIVYILDTLQIKNNLPYIFSYVDKKRLEKASNFANEEDKLQCLGAGYLIKKYLPNREILENKNGKPYFAEGPFFNISHSGNFVVFVISNTNEVGIDIERIDEKKIGAIKFTLNEAEKEINDAKTLFRMWSNKESLIKCMSSNLNDVKLINGFPLEGLRVVDGKSYYSKSMLYNGYSLSVTLKQKESFNVSIKQVEIAKSLNKPFLSY